MKRTLSLLLAMALTCSVLLSAFPALVGAGGYQKTWYLKDELAKSTVTVSKSSEKPDFGYSVFSVETTEDGGGAFSGKDPTKVDRSACYAARYIAKNVVAAGLAKRCEVQVAYAIGVARPVSVMIDTFGTSVVDEAKISEAVLSLVDLRPAAIIRDFDLRKPIYCDLAAYGHMGREDLGVAWEKRDLAEKLKAMLL